MEICKYIIFRKVEEMKIERSKKFGGNVEYESYDELEKDFREGKLHPVDLKNSVSEQLVKILQPVGKYFEKNKEAQELLEFMKKQNVTR